jgi:hypothetical protein
MGAEQKISGGFILISRKWFDCYEITNGPPLRSKLWIWMLLKANFKDHGKLKRGQLFTTIEEIRNAMSYRKGYCVTKPTIDEIRSAYEAFTKATMITTTKTTRGMIITILNYNKYQNPENYEAHTEPHNENFTKPTVTPHYKERKRNKENKTRGGHSLPVDFKMTDDLKAWAEEKGYNRQLNLERETEKFLNYWQSNGKCKKDWSATWRNWIIKAVEFAEEKGKPAGKPFFSTEWKRGSWKR